MKQNANDLLRRKIRIAWVRLSVLSLLVVGVFVGCRSHLESDKPSQLWNKYNQQIDQYHK